jgi:methionine synthase II (cobalamin-independent)
MKHSTERILTTHVGSLARAESLLPLLRQREQGKPYDRDELARLVREAVADVVRKQIEAGSDIVTDGEQGEHPELVAERILRFTKLVGRENVIAGADCGFATAALRFNDTHPSVAWLKFAALAEGARLATKELWK